MEQIEAVAESLKLTYPEKEWQSDIFSLSPIHSFIEEEGIPL